MLQNIEFNSIDGDSKTKTNAELLDDTYYEYHGRHDDGNSPAELFDRLISKGVVIV